MEQLYSEEAQTKHKEGGEKMIYSELVQSWQNSHPLLISSDVLYNIVSGQVAPNEVNIGDAVLIGEKMAHSFCNYSLPSGFHATISR